MQKPVQKRTLKTRARMLDVALGLVEENGYDALRVEEVVSQAGVAKGTFFAHFRDKDGLMEHMIGTRAQALLDQMEQSAAPSSVPDLIARLQPLHDLMTSERYVFDLMLRYSGATAIQEIGPVAHVFGRYIEIVTRWCTEHPFRSDISAELQAEGVQAFAVQAMALKFCALHSALSFEKQFAIYLTAWLCPAG